MAARMRSTFADIVAEVKATPPRVVPAGPYGQRGAWVDHDGREYAPVCDDISAERAADLARRGALVVYDVCGCLGWCHALLWLDDDRRAELARASPPVIGSRRSSHAAIEEFRSADGRTLLLVIDDVVWGEGTW